MALSFSPSKNLEPEGIFKSASLRWLWRFYTQRMTSAARWFLWPTVAFMSYGSSSLQLQGYVPFSYASGLWIVALLSLLLFKPRVLFKARHAERICAGEVLPVDVEVKRTHGFTTELTVVPHRLPDEVDVVPESGATLEPLAEGQTSRARLGLRCGKRGVYTLRGFRVETDFPIGLLRGQQVFDDEQRLVVYPKFSPLGRLDVPIGRRYHPGGIAMVSSVGDSFEFIGNREYREGDNIRDIDWRATARLSKPIVREYREEYFLRAAVILDTHVLPRAAQQNHDAFERAVSVCASVSDYMSRQDYLVDIFAAGPNLYHLTAGRSLAYLDQILDILACVEENPDEPFTVIEPQLVEHLSKITAVICVFLDWNEIRRDFVQNLRNQGAGVKVVIVRDSECTLDPHADGEVVPVISKSVFDNGIEEL
jgi:uncharacterized protein (DUF58 family)